MNPVDRYSIHIFLDEQDGTYLAITPEFPGVSAFGDSPGEALVEARVALALAVEAYADEGWPLPIPITAPDEELPSGEFRVRIPRSMHAQLAQRSATEGVSQNQLMVAYLAMGLASAELNTVVSARLDVLEETLRRLAPTALGKGAEDDSSSTSVGLGA